MLTPLRLVSADHEGGQTVSASLDLDSTACTLIPMAPTAGAAQNGHAVRAGALGIWSHDVHVA